jgi:hypothetical protein
MSVCPGACYATCEVVDGLDLGNLGRPDAGKRSSAVSPAQLRSVLIYSYATGCYPRRNIAQVIYDSLAFRYIPCNRHPDQSTPAIRQGDLGRVCGDAQGRAREPGKLLRRRQPRRHQDPGQRQASQSPILGHAETTEAHLRAQVQELQELAEQVAGPKVSDELTVPKELKRLVGRLVASGEAKGEIEPRAAKCLVGEQAKYKAKLILREKEAAADVDTAAIEIRVSDGANLRNQ